jgi:hypothetical protein
VAQGGPTAVERIEIDGFVIRGALLPTPKEETPPLERSSAHGGLRRFPLVAWLLVIDLRPARRPDGCGGPLDEGLAEALRTLEAPVPPRCLATAFGYWRAPRLFLPGSGGSIACPWCAAGDEQPGGEAGACPGERLAQGDIGRVVRALCAGVSNGLEGLSGDPERVAPGLAE